MWLKGVKGVVLGLFLLSTTPRIVLADSAYVLPYPGLMPGNKLYKIEQAFDQLYRPWVFGNFSRHKYELGLADKKLVEAKVLFEYRQYLLAVRALTDSDRHFQKAVYYLDQAEKEGKDISQKTTNLQAAAGKHREVLQRLKEQLPEEFIWRPEKGEATELNLKLILEEAMRIREI